ncbi:MAG: hypothetical protein U1B81_01825 [Arthrobacter sp.]|nr:hypothetical protein [Arthrobacter sp.]
MNDRPITRADLAIAFERGYWRGVDHKGPLNGAAVAALNPYKKSGLDTSAKKSVQTATETPTNEEIPLNKSIKYPATVREAGDIAQSLGLALSEFLETFGPAPTMPARSPQA